MSLLSDLNSILGHIGLPVETGVFSDSPPDEYLVITPLSENFDLFADDGALSEVLEARLSLFSKANYQARKKELVSALLVAGITISDRRYIGFEEDTKYHHFAIDVMKEYETEE